MGLKDSSPGPIRLCTDKASSGSYFIIRTTLPLGRVIKLFSTEVKVALLSRFLPDYGIISSGSSSDSGSYGTSERSEEPIKKYAAAAIRIAAATAAMINWEA